jgi:peptidoglycan/xylan/chitin deacetylase (PgdA/CDA1 family)
MESEMNTTRSLIAASIASLFAMTAWAAGPAKLKVALTFDDLPVNGGLAPGDKPSDYARATIAVLKKHRVPPSYGFINARQLEWNPDGAEALKIWVAGGHPLANHTYNHLDLTKNTAADFQLEVLRNQPVLALLMPPEAFRGKHDWRWFRYPYLHEGDTLEKRREVRAFLANAGYRIAQTTLDFEDYMWNGAHARCVGKKDEAAIRWLRETYLKAAAEFTPFQVELSRRTFGRDINHVMLLHLGSFSSHILPDLLTLLKKQNFEIVTLEEAQSDPIYALDPDFAHPRGGTHTELSMQAKNIAWPAGAPTQPREEIANICK